MAEASDLTPFEWLARLGKKLKDRRPQVDYWRRYYRGDQDLPSGPSQHAEAYRRFQKKARLNLCLLCAESRVHRTQVIGFRDPLFNSREIDPVWQLWQHARLDARQFGLWRKTYSRSTSYAILGVDPRKASVPRVTIEGPETVIVETDPGDRSVRLAALRLWHDSIARRWYATLYLPGLRYRWQSKNLTRSGVTSALSFKPSSWELRDPEPARSLPYVPVWEFLNGDGDEDEEPAASFDVGLDTQDRLNLTVLNRLTAERYAAFRQRGLTNYTADTDPDTGLPVSPFNPGAQYLWTVPPSEDGGPEPRFFDFAQTDTANILRAAESDMRAFAMQTLTPVYYLPGDMINIGADAVAALDAGHVQAIKQLEAQWTENVEDLLQGMADIAGLDRDLSQSEAVWERPENFNMAQVADFISKMSGSGVPLPMVMEEVGWSPQRVSQLRSELAQQQMQQAIQQALLNAQRPPADAAAEPATQAAGRGPAAA
ncbi:phage portal protein [Amycolatopsis sp. NPDC004368]